MVTWVGNWGVLDFTFLSHFFQFSSFYDEHISVRQVKSNNIYCRKTSCLDLLQDPICAPLRDDLI